MVKKVEKADVSSCKTCECGWDCGCKKCCCVGKVLLAILTILWVVAAIMACFYSFKSYQLNTLSAWGSENVNKMIEMYKSEAYVKQATERTDSQVSAYINNENETYDEGNVVCPNISLPTFNAIEPVDYWFEIWEPLSSETVASLKENGVVYGPENAKITILEFADASCGYCKRQVAQDYTVDAVLAQYPNDVNVIFKNFPIFNETAAEAMACAEDYLSAEDYHHYVISVFGADDASNANALANLAACFGADTTAIANCINNGDKANEVSATMSEWQTFGISGTPSSVIINNESGKFAVVPGAYPAEAFAYVVEALL